MSPGAWGLRPWPCCRSGSGRGSVPCWSKPESPRSANDAVRSVVLGHPEYYPRFGFAPASSRGLSCQWDGVPYEAFMVLVLDECVMAGVSGVARYRGEFDQAM